MSLRAAAFRIRRSPSVRRVVATVPVIAVALGLQAAWLTTGFAAWNVEMERIQMTADAAALAGAAEYALVPAPPSADRARAVAFEYATLNNPRGHPQEVVIEFGSWDRESHEFTRGRECATATRVTVRRTGLLGAIGPVLYRDLLGWSAADGEATAMAETSVARVSGPCRGLARVLRLID